MFLTVYPSQSRSDEELKLLRAVWCEILVDVPDDALKTATREYLNSGQTFAPAPGVLRARATEIMGLDGDAMAERAWQAVIDNEHGHGRPLDDRLALITMQRIGGWEAWNNVESDDVHWWHERFIKAYADSFGRQTAGMALPPGDDKAAQLIGAVTAKLTSATKQIGDGDAKH